MPQHDGLKFRDLVRLSFRTFRVKPTRAALTILGMSVGIGAVLFLVSLGYGLQYILIGKLVTTQDSLITMEVSYPSESNLTISDTTLKDIRGISNVAEVSPVADFSGEIRSATSSGLLISTKIIEPSYFRLTGSLPDLGESLSSGDNGIVISAQTLAPINLKPDATSLGKNLGLKVFYDDPQTGLTEEASSTVPLVIRGIITDTTLPPTILLFSNLLDRAPPFYRQALVKAVNINSVEMVRDQLLNRGFLVSARIDLVNQANNIMNAITIVLGVFGVTALVVSAIGMFNTMIVGFLERIYEVGILKSLGATDEDVRNLFLMESTMMGLFGGVGGIVLGLAVGKSLNAGINLLASRLGGKPFDLFITPSWFIILILLFSAIIGFASGFWPARRAAGLSPKEAFTKR